MKSDAKRSDTGLTLKEAMHLQALAGNPLDAEDVAMFEMFDREGWSEERCIEYILQKALQGREVSVDPKK